MRKGVKPRVSYCGYNPFEDKRGIMGIYGQTWRESKGYIKRILDCLILIHCLCFRFFFGVILKYMFSMLFLKIITASDIPGEV